MAGYESSSIPHLNQQINVTSLNHLNVDILRICALSFGVLFGPPAHIYILWLIVRARGIASEFLNFQISVSDIIICVNSFLMLLELRFAKINSYSSFALGLIITGRPLFQCLMCVERYLAVVHPVTFLKYKPLRYKWFCSAAVWFTVLSSCLFSMLTTGLYIHVHMCGILLQFVLIFSINMFCCLAVLWALKKPGPGERGKEREEENHMKRRAFYLILITTVTIVIMFAPVIFSVTVYLLVSHEFLMFSSFSLFCFNLAGFVQPVLYLRRAGKLRFLSRSFSKLMNYFSR